MSLYWLQTHNVRVKIKTPTYSSKDQKVLSDTYQKSAMQFANENCSIFLILSFTFLTKVKQRNTGQ